MVLAGLAIGDRAAKVSNGTRNDRWAVHIGWPRGDVLRRDVTKAPSGIREVLPLRHLVASEHAHGELAGGDHQRMSVMPRRDARHHHGLLETDLGDPMAGVGTGNTVVSRAHDFDPLHHLSEALLHIAVDHPVS